MAGKNYKLPFAEIIEEGLKDLKSETPKPTLAALLVSIGAPKLRSLGYYPKHIIPEPEKKLYALAAQARPEGGAHSYYNSLIRRLSSFERAASCAK